jgi:cyclohexyl-isocyanide hydratase
MQDEEVLTWLRNQWPQTRYILSVCTGALTLGAAGLLHGRRVTTHWNSFHLLPHFGAIAENARVVVDGNFVSTAGVSAGIDGSLRLAELLSGPEIAQQIQLEIQYAPDPPFHARLPADCPQSILGSARKRAARQITETRTEIAEKFRESTRSLTSD